MSSANQIFTPQTNIPAHLPDQARWYAIHTRCRHEKKVDSSLRQFGVATFLPMVEEIHHWSDRRQTVSVPLFACYTFAFMDIASRNRMEVLKTPGVLSFVGGQNGAIPIPLEEIEQVQRVLTERLPMFPYPFLKVGQRVRVRGGSLDGVEGIWLGRQQGATVVISIELIQRSVAVRVDGYDVEAI